MINASNVAICTAHNLIAETREGNKANIFHTTFIGVANEVVSHEDEG